ncbi:spinster family MFS transporter [Burkholderia sp. MR1-5-21]
MQDDQSLSEEVGVPPSSSRPSLGARPVLLAPRGSSGTHARTGWVLMGLLAVSTWNYLDRSAIGILQEPIKREFGLSDFQLGLLGGPAFALLYVLLGIPFGRLAERVNRVRLIAVVFAFWSIMTALCGAATGYLLLLMARAGVSVGEAGAGPSAHSLIADHFTPDRRPWALAVYTSGISLGSLVAALAGGSIAQWLGWRATFFALGASGLLLALMFLFTVPEAPRTTRVEDAPSFSETVRFLVVRPVIWHIAFGIMVAAMLSLSTMQYLTSFFIRSHHMSLSQAVVYVALIGGVAGAIGTHLGGALGNRLAKHDVKAATSVVARAYLIALPLFVTGFLAPDPILATAMLMAGTAAQSTYFGPTFAVLHSTVEPRMRGTAVALVLLVANLLGYGLGPPVVGAISDRLSKFLASGSASSQDICSMAAWLKPACAVPIGGGLQWSLALLALCNLWAFYHFNRISQS